MLKNKNVWSWEAKEQQINENSKVGDVVDVGYLWDCNNYNYKQAVITRINKLKDNLFQIWVKFEDDYEMIW